ncbi:hypothetical protein HDU84_000647 [Entophlyctis sp. JEL0112]|nr:hypothetical protein HDU84_000647 [Entophlyctis sp. JEL0112]
MGINYRVTTSSSFSEDTSTKKAMSDLEYAVTQETWCRMTMAPLGKLKLVMSETSSETIPYRKIREQSEYPPPAQLASETYGFPVSEIDTIQSLMQRNGKAMFLPAAMDVDLPMDEKHYKINQSLQLKVKVPLPGPFGRTSTKVFGEASASRLTFFHEKIGISRESAADTSVPFPVFGKIDFTNAGALLDAASGDAAAAAEALHETVGAVFGSWICDVLNPTAPYTMRLRWAQEGQVQQGALSPPPPSVAPTERHPGPRLAHLRGAGAGDLGFLSASRPDWPRPNPCPPHIQAKRGVARTFTNDDAIRARNARETPAAKDSDSDSASASASESSDNDIDSTPIYRNATRPITEIGSVEPLKIGGDDDDGDAAPVFETANGNHQRPAPRKIKDLAGTTAAAAAAAAAAPQPQQMSRKEREALEAERKKAAFWKAQMEGNTEQARSDLARLAIIKKQREEAARKKAEEAAAKAAGGAKKQESRIAGQGIIGKTLGGKK